MMNHDTSCSKALDLDKLGLGKFQTYPEAYDPSLLQPIPRALNRQNLAIQEFNGCDIWTGYELSWLDLSGKPCVAIAEFTVPANTPNIIESKSFKYYLNSFNQERIERSEIKQRLENDLTQAAGGKIAVQIHDLDHYVYPMITLNDHFCVDHCELTSPTYTPDASRLTSEALDDNYRSNVELSLANQPVKYVSHLLKSNCPVTGQPDWASVWICLEGAYLAPENFLAYIVSYRDHQDFHENCVEHIYNDIYRTLNPSSLWVYARYTRRGGLDINPFRTSQSGGQPPSIRAARQ